MTESRGSLVYFGRKKQTKSCKDQGHFLAPMFHERSVNELGQSSCQQSWTTWCEVSWGLVPVWEERLLEPMPTKKC